MNNRAVVAGQWELHWLHDRLYITHEVVPELQITLTAAETWGLLSFLEDCRSELWRLVRTDEDDSGNH